MIWFDLVVLAVLAVVAVRTAFPTPTRLAARRQHFSAQTGAYVDPSFVADLDAEARRVSRWAGLLLLLLGASLFVDQVTSLPPMLLFVPLLAAWFAVFAGLRLRAAGWEFRVPGVRASVARPRRVTVSDYVSTWSQVLAWLAVGLTLAVAVATVLLWRHGEISGATTVVTLIDGSVVLVMAAATQWFARSLCARPTPAVDASHLYLQDAWRSQALGASYGAVGLSAFLLSNALFASAVGPPWFRGVLELVSLLMIGGGIAAQLAQRGRFRRRLWGTLPPGQVLLPGQPVPPRARAVA